MFPPDLNVAIENKIPYAGSLDISPDLFPSWEDIVPFFDKSFLNGNQRARDPHKIFVNMKDTDFAIIREVKLALGKLLGRAGLSCHCYAGFSPNAIASPPHSDGMEVFFVMIKGTMPWKIFADGCDYNDKTKTMTSKSTFSQRLNPGDFVYVPTGIYHVALPDCSRVGFSFGW